MTTQPTETGIEEKRTPMYFVKIPLAHLAQPHELNLPADKQQEAWQHRVNMLLIDLRHGQIPSWATSYKDLEALRVEREDEQ